VSDLHVCFSLALSEDHCTDCEGKSGEGGSRDRIEQEFAEMRISKTVSI